jgi:hypothetical protein
MTGITKCHGSMPAPGKAIICPMRETCWRWTAPAGGRQSYMHAPLYQLSGGGEWKCDEYWKR